MKKFLVAAVLALISITTEAANTFYLTQVSAYNPFNPSGSPIGGPLSVGGRAFVDDSSTVTVTGVQFSFVSVNSTFNYTDGNWSTVEGGSSIEHTETCIESTGTPCTGALSGLTGVWNNTQANGGLATGNCIASAYFAAGPCDRVAIAVNPGIDGGVTIVEQSEFAIPGQPVGLFFCFNTAIGTGPGCPSISVVPVPAAFWLFASALGIMGWIRFSGR